MLGSSKKSIYVLLLLLFLTFFFSSAFLSKCLALSAMDYIANSLGLCRYHHGNVKGSGTTSILDPLLSSLCG